MWGRILGLSGMAFFYAGGAMSGSVEFVDRFKEIGQDWHVAEYDFSHDKFDTDWRRAQVIPGATDGGEGLKLRLSPHKAGLNRFAGGSIRREEVSHFGYYEARLRAASQPGK